MQMLRCSLFALVLVALSAVSASAQLQAGSNLYFDHPVTDSLDTEYYELCVDALTAEACSRIAVLVAGTVNAVNTYSFTLPATVVRGNHGLMVRAIGYGDFGPTAPSNTLNARIIGKPGPPVSLRLQQAATP